MNKDNNSNHHGNWWLILAVVSLTIFPPIFIKGEYSGVDGEAQEIITKIQPEYKPWMDLPFKPASAEIESLLFVVQGALGAGVIGYAIGLYQGKKQGKEE